MTTRAPASPSPTDDPAPARVGAAPSRSFWSGTLHVLAFSVAATASAAIVATIAWLVGGVEWPTAFVMLRWLVVAVLLATPLVHQVASRTGATWTLPWALRTPATALVLTVESIGFDILSARLTE